MTATSLRLRRLRKERGLTQTQVARRLGYESQSAYAHLESGRVGLKAEQAIKLAEMFGCKVDDLYEKEECRTIRYGGREYRLITDYASSTKTGYATFANCESGMTRILSIEWYQHVPLIFNHIILGGTSWNRIDDMRDDI